MRMQKTYKNGTWVVVESVCESGGVKFIVDTSWSKMSTGYMSIDEVEKLVSNAATLDQTIGVQLMEYLPRLEALGFKDAKNIK